MVTPKFPPDLSLSHSPSGPILCFHSHMGNEFSSVICAALLVSGFEFCTWPWRHCESRAMSRSTMRSNGRFSSLKPPLSWRYYDHPTTCGSNCFLEKRNSAADMHFQHLLQTFCFPKLDWVSDSSVLICTSSSILTLLS